ITYTDWRADTLVDRSSINTQIGNAPGVGRFGNYTTPIFGTLVHEVTYGYAFDGGDWVDDQQLPANAASRLLNQGRTAFEANLDVPANKSKLSLYFHVRTYLIADYSQWGNVTDKWYQDQQKVLVRERWDNPNGAYSNYDFDLE